MKLALPFDFKGMLPQDLMGNNQWRQTATGGKAIGIVGKPF
jgi:hypothetical protein